MIKRYRVDPKNPLRLTPEQEQRLKKARIDYSDIPPLGDEFFSTARRPATTDKRRLDMTNPEEARRRQMRFLFCCSCGTLHLGDPAATTDLCANCQGSKFRLASIEMVTQPIPSVRWPRPF